jgi:hypothetical protein
VDELVKGVNIALGQTPYGECRADDDDGDDDGDGDGGGDDGDGGGGDGGGGGSVSVDELAWISTEEN